jgi:hypothetical protein
VAFKITIESKFNNDHLKFNGDFESHVTFGMTQGGLEHYMGQEWALDYMHKNKNTIEEKTNQKHN